MDYQSRREYKVLYILVTILGILNIILAFIWTCSYLGGFGWQDDPLHQFNFHIVFAALGLVLYGKGLLIYRTFHYKAKSTLKLYHTIAMLIVFVFSVFSLKCVFDSHNYRIKPIPNLYSLHSWIGLGTVILFSTQFFLGFIFFLYPRSNASYKRLYLRYHQFFGVIIFILAVISCHSGIMEKVKAAVGKDYQTLPPVALVPNFLGVAITIFAILILFLALTPQFKRIPLPEEDKISFEMRNNA